MGVPKRLTEMQQRFAELLVFGGPEGPMTQSEAAIAAGYSPKRARQEGSELCNPRLSVNAEANRGKAAGLYIDRKIIKTGKLEDMSEQELEAKMRQLLTDYGQIIDVTPSKVSESSSPKLEESSSDPQK
jgi:phage terminase small subunit